MMPLSADCELVTAYAARGSENAFRALVTRHVNLVYATAFRQVGDATLAEEITQNVFIALARKAPRLAGIQTLAGWLLRTAVLEAKARIRPELRRGPRAPPHYWPTAPRRFRLDSRAPPRTPVWPPAARPPVSISPCSSLWHSQKPKPF